MENNFEPFGSIGLCFSGGGYRATFFSLGVVSYLNRIQLRNKSLLDNVEAISTVSGGTLLGVAFAKATQETDFKFETFYKEFYNTFIPESDSLLQNSLSKLRDDFTWKENYHKKRSLINAFALAYSDLNLFKGEFEMFKDMKSSNLKHVCFNATEFSYGLAFRFQNTGKFGNNPLNCKELEKNKDKIKLSDIVASSSCFPLGFEPLVFPDDYIKEKDNDDYKALKRLDDFINGVGVMDGGIIDNQGIGSMINISKSKKRQKPLDLFIVNDVGSYKMDPWQTDDSKSFTKKSLKETFLGYLKYFKINWIYWTILLFGVLLMVVNSLELIKGKSWISLYVLGGIITGIGISLTMLGMVTGLIKANLLKGLKLTLRRVVPKSLFEEVISFHRLNFGLIKWMLNERLTSTVKMVSEVFLKQLRRMNYDLLYSKGHLQNKIITSTVYELNDQETLYNKKKRFNEKIKPAPGKQLKKVALLASDAPTSLWWDENDKSHDRMDCLIACGQFTTCYNLMDYILKLKKSEITSKEIDDMYSLLEKDWKEFNKNPLFIV
ncbi:MAG: patatin-like phospholipase family protein [Bacteroidota bacterium]